MSKKLQIRKLLPFNLLQVSVLSLYAVINLNSEFTLAATTVKLNQWQFNPKSQKLEITLSAATKPEYFYLNQPPRLVVDLPNTQLGKVETKKTYPATMQKVRVSQFTSNITRIVIDLEPGTFIDVNQVKLQSLSSQNPTRWVLSSPPPNHNTNLINPPSSDPMMTLPPPSTNLPSNPQPFVIVPPPNSQNTTQLSNLNIIPPNSAENNNMVTLPNYPPNFPNPQNNNNQILEIPIIEFGQPLPIIK
ncbi:AMIN domain-containing protein [Okeanomitos corallinicola TIOX110]|uniref:AMIN domain-containing protein n=1 Tax=Okeanomitos corallinicola TIOX110 TaxID=3133117 RepID=A0ABZ2UTV8_9CYAN